MTKEEFNKRLNKLSEQFDKDKESLYMQYAKENCNIEIGDIVTDHTHTIKVESMASYYDFSKNEPLMVFYGPDHKKDGTISKRQTNTPVYQSNVEFVNGKKYIKLL